MGLGPQEIWAEHLPCTTPGVDPGLWPLPWREMTENLGDRGARRDTKRGRDREGTRRHKLGLGLSVSDSIARKVMGLPVKRKYESTLYNLHIPLPILIAMIEFHT